MKCTKKRSGYTKKKPFKYVHAKIIKKRKWLIKYKCKICIARNTEMYNEVRDSSFKDI